MLADCWAYSDSRNDIPLLELVGNRVVVNPDAALARHAQGARLAGAHRRRREHPGAARRVRREARAVAKASRG